MKLNSLIILFFNLTLAGCSGLHFSKPIVNINRVSLSEVHKECGVLQMYGCAKWYPYGLECNIYINAALTASMDKIVLDHEENHCKHGKFHK